MQLDSPQAVKSAISWKGVAGFLKQTTVHFSDIPKVSELLIFVPLGGQELACLRPECPLRFQIRTGGSHRHRGLPDRGGDLSDAL